MKHETNSWSEESQNGHIILNYGTSGITVQTLYRGQSFGTKHRTSGSLKLFQLEFFNLYIYRFICCDESHVCSVLVHSKDNVNF